ncbi:MAG: hypothetical protein KGY65_03990 [Candidatus Thermoplasmatota archaeon]|nr:hypothetical protein [Candidatus Thermoplasmatota archaeon]MBS3801892.1 hypothetical protein [Candidatus Thermoplasmatota archaeon]
MAKSDQQIRHDSVQLMARIMSYLPVILIKSGTAWLSFKRQAKKGGKTFQKELINQGLDKEIAVQFTKEYTSSSNLVKILFNHY